jgi:Homeodomain-like domain
VSGPVRPLRTVAGMDIVRITHLPTTPHAGRPRRSSDLTRRLNAEWEAVLADPGVRAELQRAPIAGHSRLDTLLAACGGDRSVDHETADALLARVVAAGLEGRTLAIRVVLQRALGSLVTIAVQRTRGQPGRRAALFDELCSTAWIVIGSYPLARRPRSVLTNVVRDAEYLTCVRPQRLHDVSHRVTLLDEHVPEVGLRGGRSEHAADELHDLVLGVGGRRGLVEGDLALLHALAAGQSVSAIAQALGCTDRTVRNRRRRLVTKLQELSAADA